MRSIKTKMTALVILCTLLTAGIIGAVSVQNSKRVVADDATQIMQLLCRDEAEGINALLSRIEQSVTTLADYLTANIGDIKKFQSDPAYVREFTDSIERMVVNAGNNTEGALTVYVRYNPEFAEPTSGLFFTRPSRDSAFDKLVPTDFSMYDPSDTAHVGWYYIPVQNGKPTWMAPYVNENLGINMISYVIPLVMDGKSIGIVGMDLDFGILESVVDDIKVYESGYAFLADAGSQIVHHPQLDMNQPLAQAGEGMDALAAQLASAPDGETLFAYRYQGVEKKMVHASLDNGMKLVLTAPEKEIDARANSLMVHIVLISLVAFAVSLFVSVLMLHRMVKPIRALSAVAKRIAEGDWEVTIEHQSRDEIGTLADSFGMAVAQLRQYGNYIDEAASVLNQMAQGDLVISLRYEYAGQFAKLKEALMQVSNLLNRTLRQIHQVSGQVAVSSSQVADSAQALSQGAAEQASSVESLSATIADISNQTRDTAENARSAAALSAQAGEGIADSNRKMDEMTQAMKRIATASDEIEKVVRTIDDIASQTNILALNAAVEAARAGAAGKGFAVVADEVRRLAQKSAEAVKTTTDLIGQTIHAVENGTQIAQETADSLHLVVERVSEANGKISEIAAASNIQAESVAQVTQGVEQISSVVQTNSATAQESAATSEELNGQAQKLKTLIERFRLRDDDTQALLP